LESGRESNPDKGRQSHKGAQGLGTRGSMRIAGRLALHDNATISPVAFGASAQPPLCGYHGADIVLHRLDESGFAASFGHIVPTDSIVRLRLPGSGMMLAKVVSHCEGTLRADFLNPVPQSRLRKTFGWQTEMRSYVAA
jgi:hypothetical protein